MNRTQDETPTIDSPPPHEVLRAVTRTLRCQLTADEHRAKGRELATRMVELAELKARHKYQVAEMKAAEAEVARQVDDLRDDVASQTEARAVDCEEIADYRKGVVELIRTDTGAVVSTRPIEAGDRQRSLQ